MHVIVSALRGLTAVILAAVGLREANERWERRGEGEARAVSNPRVEEIPSWRPRLIVVLAAIGFSLVMGPKAMSLLENEPVEVAPRRSLPEYISENLNSYRLRIGPAASASAPDVSWFCNQRYAIGDSAGAWFGLPQDGTAPNDSTPSECFAQWQASVTPTTDNHVIVNTGVSTHGMPAGLTNVDSVPFCDDTSCMSLMKKVVSTAGMDTIPVGGYGFSRHYYRSLFAPGTIQNAHYYQRGDGDIGSPFYTVWWNIDGTVASDSTFANGINLYANGAGDAHGPGKGLFTIVDRSTGDYILKTHETYALEYRVYRFKADSARVNARVKNEAGTVVATSGNFICSGPPDSGCGLRAGITLPNLAADTLGAYPILWDATANSLSRGLEFGNNGNAPGQDPVTTQWLILGGPAWRVSMDEDDWIDEYPAPGEPGGGD